MASKSKSTRRSKKESPDGTEVLVTELQEIHNAETQLSRVLPRLAKAVESEALREKLEERLAQGEQLIQDVETCLEGLDESPGRKKNVAAEGLINDAREHVQEIEAGPALDTVLIGAVQQENKEPASPALYFSGGTGTARKWRNVGAASPPRALACCLLVPDSNKPDQKLAAGTPLPRRRCFYWSRGVNFNTTPRASSCCARFHITGTSRGAGGSSSSSSAAMPSSSSCQQ